MTLLEKAPPVGSSGWSALWSPAGTYRKGSVPKKILLGRSHQLLELACKVAGAAVGGLGLVSAEGELAEHIAFGISEDAASEMRRSPQLTELLQFILRQPEPTCLDDLGAAQPRLGVWTGLPALGPFLGLPLQCPSRYRGALYLVRRPGQPAFGPADGETIEPIRAWLEQGSLFEEAHLLSQLRLLNRVAQTAASNLDLALILERSLRELDRHLPLDVSAVWLVDDQEPGWLTLEAVNSIPSTRASAMGLVPGLRLAVDQTPFGGCLLDGQGLYTDLGAGPDSLAGRDVLGGGHSALDSRLAAHGACCFFAAPLRAGDRTVGVLQSVCNRPAGFTGEQIQLLYLVADLLGPAISNCRLFGRLRSTYEELNAAQDHLIHTEKMRALGELASGMAHDFNNSLCGVLGFLELAMTDETLSPAGHKFLEAAHTCALDAAQTVRRVQDFARCRRKEPDFQTLDVNDLLQQTVELTRHKWDGLSRAPGAPISVEVLAEATARVSGNAGELREALTNLIFNAVDAMPQGGKLSVRSWSTASDVFIAVQDTGVGMNTTVRQRLFEPFFTTKGERGNGLGLSVTFGIVQEHGGDINVASEVGRGATLTIRLPALPETAQDAPLRTATDEDEVANVFRSQEGLETRPQSCLAGSGSPDHPPIEDPNPNELGPDAAAPVPPAHGPASLRILVVEDEEKIRSFLDRVLKHLGHHPRVAADATDGLAAFAAGHFDLVVTDYGLPGMNGEELARAIAAQSPETPVVLLTGWADQLVAEGKSLPGVNRILGKPLTINQLAETLDVFSPRT
jgi:signal transduction histidine kinase/CheY-like chemotaxis protein